MPIKDTNVGKYTRPGIYIEEIDNSLITLPIQDILINLIPGFSRKGPFNKPVFVDNTTSFEQIFGTKDRRLENKGSFFHRSVNKMLQTGPVWALNLLKTDDTRDKLAWKTVSVSAFFENGVSQLAPYSRFFNRQDFWERDADAFMSIVQNPTPDHDRLLHITNMGDKTITTFMFKSSITGFDITAEEWYGGLTKVPTYIQPKSWISDYIITVLVLQGNWTNYDQLAVDTTFSKYFNKNGLIKSNIQNFVNERTVTTLGNFDVSLIPNFKDLDGKDMYIKSVINNQTDITGLFVTYDEDALLGSDYPTDTMDILGETIADTDVSTINFLSYNTTISETLTYAPKYLDSPLNVVGLGTGITYNAEGEDTRDAAYYTNWKTDNIAVSASSITGVTIASSNGTYELNGTEYSLSSSTINLDPLTVTLTGTSYTRYDVIYLTSDNTTIGVIKGTQSGSTDSAKPSFTINNENSIILGYVKVQWSGGTGYNSSTYTSVTTDTNYVPFSNYTLASVTGSTSTTNYLQMTFNGTSGATDLTNYSKLRSLKIFAEMSENITSESVILSGTTKVPVISTTVTSASSTSNGIIKIYVDPSVNPSSLYTNSKDIIIHYIDDEFVAGNGDVTEFVTSYPTCTSTKGIVGQYSTFYQNYIDGLINTNDFFYPGNDTGSTTKIYIKPFIADDILTVKLANNPEDSDGAIITWSDYGTTGITVNSHKGNIEQTVEIESLGTQTDLTKIVQIWVNKTRYSEMKKGLFLLAYYNTADYESGGQYYGQQPKKFTRIINTQNDPYNTNLKILYTDAPIMVRDANSGGTTDYYTLTYQSVDQYVTEYQGVSIDPFVVSVDSMPNGTDSRQSDILDVLDINLNLAKGLVNKNKITWRYLIDSFGLGLTSLSKQQYLDLCGAKLNCLGFISMPSAKDFRNSSSPYFLDDNYALSTSYIKEGGNPDLNPDFLYSFGEGKGQSTVGYFFPYVKTYDADLSQQVTVPPAAWMATTYMRKFVTNQAGVTPWTICAGINDGRVTDIAGTEMDFTDDDLTNLYQMGANAITFKAGNGYCINSESTAQVFPRSSLSYIHSREVLIELENRMYDMLLGYQWKFNTASTRAEIKFRADKICKDMMDQGALYNYKNVIDETNNTPYIIDLSIGVLDSYIEVVKGMAIIVNNITILRTGAINSGGFA